MHEIARASLNERAFQHVPTLYTSPSCVQYNKGDIDKLKLNTEMHMYWFCVSEAL